MLTESRSPLEEQYDEIRDYFARSKDPMSIMERNQRDTNDRTPVDNLYLCGAGTHPGGEVTGAPGHNAAHAVLRDWELA